MNGGRERHLLDEIAKRDAIIERQAAEILVLRQTIDAISRRVFAYPARSSIPNNSNSSSPPTRQKSQTPPSPQTTDRRLKSKTTISAGPKSAPHASRIICPFNAKRSFPPKSGSSPPPTAASARKCASNSASSPPSSTVSSSCGPNMSASTTRWPSPSSHRCRRPRRIAASPPPA